MRPKPLMPILMVMGESPGGKKVVGARPTILGDLSAGWFHADISGDADRRMRGRGGSSSAACRRQGEASTQLDRAAGHIDQQLSVQQVLKLLLRQRQLQLLEPGHERESVRVGRAVLVDAVAYGRAPQHEAEAERATHRVQFKMDGPGIDVLDHAKELDDADILECEAAVVVEADSERLLHRVALAGLHAGHAVFLHIAQHIIAVAPVERVIQHPDLRRLVRRVEAQCNNEVAVLQVALEAL
mmetsp:Transcript_7148/g.12857  ORF Transcript_7148/g.12857 Transcript_7148/m.12857 type:complete len:242 (+) Transcript_7148:2-727(+)